MSITAFNNKLQDLVKTEERELDGTGLQPPTIDSFDGAGQLVKRVGNFGSTDPAPQTNYFIHSSVLGKLVSEADETGRKLKTFVPANGVTLAQQQVIYYQGTTERLTFVHQDASTTGTQETNDDGTLVNVSNRSGEYDPLGRNIASAGPYISLDTNPQSGDGVSGINMFGSGEGYRPGQQSYRIDHLAVPASLFMEEINTGRFGGAFGLLEMAARMSAVEIEWQRTWEWQTTSTASDGTVRVNTHSLTLTMEVFQIQNWAVNLSIPQAQTRLDFPEPKTKGTVSDEQRKRLALAYDRLKQILQNKKCLDFLGGYDKFKTLLKNTRISFADDLGQVRFGDDTQ